MLSVDATSDSSSEMKTNHKIIIHKTTSQSSGEERFVLKIGKEGKNDEVGKQEMGSKITAKKGTLDRAEIGRQVHALKLSIDIMEGKRKMLQKLLDEKDKVWEKHVSHVDLLKREINLWEYDMKAMYENNISYVELVSENNKLRRENEELKKMNWDYERNYLQLEKKCDALEQELMAEFNNRPNEIRPTSSPITQQAETEENETVIEEEKFNRDLEAAISASIAIKKSDPQEKK